MYAKQLIYLIIAGRYVVKTLIKTKFFLPQSNPNHIDRPELIKRFEQGLHRQLILVSAPAGSGKSVFVSAAIERFEPDCCWVSLDAQDADPKLFLKLLLTGLQAKRPQFGLSTADILHSSSTVSTDQIITSFVNELADIDEKTFLVLDDFHSVDNTEIDDAISFIIEHKPPSLVLILITREDPSIPLARLRASGELVEFRAADLRFTEQDVAHLYIDKLQLPLSDSQVHSITQRTEGWAVGLQLAALSIQRVESVDRFIGSFSGNHRFILDYLMEEVIQQLDTDTQSFIITSARLPRFSADLCDELLNTSQSQTIIQHLTRQNLFIIPLDDQGHWYRFHHLFADALKNHAPLNKKISSEICATASQWFFEHGFLVESINLALDAQTYSKAIVYLETHWPEFKTHSNDAQLINWLKAMPESEIEKSPLISTHYAVALLSYDFEQASLWLEKAEQAIASYPNKSPSVNQSLIGYIEVGQSYRSISQGQIDQVLKHTQQALDCLDKEEYVMRSAAEILRGLMYWHTGNLDDADTSISNGYKQLKRTHDVGARLSAAYLLANIRIVQGHRAEATVLCEKNIKLAKPLDFTPQGYADLYVTLAWLEVGKHNMALAKSYLTQAYDLGETAKLLESAHNWYVIRAFIAMEEGDCLQAEELLDEARAVKTPSPAPDFAPIDLWETRFDIQQGKLNKAETWAKTVQIDSETLVNHAFLILTLARLRLAQYETDLCEAKLSEVKLCDTKPLKSNVDDMIALLARLKQQLISNHQAGLIIEVELFLSRLYLALQQYDKATETLLSALNQPEAQNQRYLFITLFHTHQKWLHNTLRSNAEAQWFLNAFDTQQNAHASFSGERQVQKNGPLDESPSLIDPLSSRELEVLQALKSDLSGPQIADSLFVSLNTLRTHTKNIYSKLAVNNRRAAIRKALELNL